MTWYQCIHMCVDAKLLQACPSLCDPMDCSPPGHQAPLSMGFSRQEYWSGLPCPPPGNLPHPGTEPTSPVSSALQVDSLPTLPPWKPLKESSGEYKICIQITIIRADKRNHKLPYGQISVLRHCQRKETVLRRRG